MRFNSAQYGGRGQLLAVDRSDVAITVGQFNVVGLSWRVSGRLGPTSTCPASCCPAQVSSSTDRPVGDMQAGWRPSIGRLFHCRGAFRIGMSWCAGVIQSASRVTSRFHSRQGSPITLTPGFSAIGPQLERTWSLPLAGRAWEDGNRAPVLVWHPRSGALAIKRSGQWRCPGRYSPFRIRYWHENIGNTKSRTNSQRRSIDVIFLDAHGLRLGTCRLDSFAPWPKVKPVKVTTSPVCRFPASHLRITEVSDHRK